MFYWLLVVTLIGIIYFLSDIPSLHLIRNDQIPLWLKQLSAKYSFKIGTKGYFSYALSLNPNFILHKIGHVIAFGTLGVSIYWATRYSVTWAVSLVAVVAALDEWHQYFVPGRDSRFSDVVLDTLAAAIFIVLVKFMKKNRSNHIP